MRKTGHLFSISAALLVLVLAFPNPGTPDQPGQEVPAVLKPGVEQTITEGEIETIVSGPKDVKEATGILIFMGWIWLSILVLAYFVRLKIKEVDRLHRLNYLSKKKQAESSD